MRSSTLVTGGSDGSVRVWSLSTYSPIHRLAAHDNSVTSLQFDDARIVSGGSDGRVKIWDTYTGGLVRELSQPADAVWRVAFESERCVVMASRKSRTIMEVWDFAPVGEDESDEEHEQERKLERMRSEYCNLPFRREETDQEMLDVGSEAEGPGKAPALEAYDGTDPVDGEEEGSEEMTD